MTISEKLNQIEDGKIYTFKQLIDIHQFIMKYEIINEFLKLGYPDLVQEPTKEFRERNMLHYRELLFNNMLDMNVNNSFEKKDNIYIAGIDGICMYNG